jgi:site-specific DNA recombinase
MKTAAIYTRVSTDNQEREGTSLQTQLEHCLTYCHDKGYDVAYRFSEAYSGLSLERPELEKLRELVRAESIDLVVVYSLDRLCRDPGHGVIITQELERHDVKLEAVTEDVENTDLGKLISYIRGFASKLEAEKIKERTVRGRRARALEGRIPHGGFSGLYGYDYDKIGKRRTINETEVSWVRQMFSWLVDEGLSTNGITFRLRDLNAPTKTGKIWNRSRVIQILKNPAYTGRTYAFTVLQGTNRRKPHSEWIEIPGVTPAIIPDDIFDEAQERLRLNAQQSIRNMKLQYLLRGHLSCKQCGRSYSGHSENNRRYYRCPGKKRMTSPVHQCKNKNWSADKIEGLVWDKIEALLNTPEFILDAIEKQRDNADNTGVLDDELLKVEKQLRQLKREQEQLLQWALKGFPEDMVVSENKKINDNRERLESQRADLERRIEESKGANTSLPEMEARLQLIRQKLTTLDFDMKRLALEMLNIKVLVDNMNIEITGTITEQKPDIVTVSS